MHPLALRPEQAEDLRGVPRRPIWGSGIANTMQRLGRDVSTVSRELARNRDG